ncbi:MAG TPA: GH116 family glycosyl hydrolase [Candidatus Brocadiia bacterium]|nr:GH116 family glycosyl hydrolase [Candidatus Brocadiia bacterium]
MARSKKSAWSARYSVSQLYDHGPQKEYSGLDGLSVAFPIGGIGTGTVSVGSGGQLIDWEIFNRPGKGKRLPYTFLFLWTKKDGDDAVAKVLEGPALPPLSRSGGLPPDFVYGLPRFREAFFTGKYPFCDIRFEDPAVPLNASMEIFNPLIPMNEKDSGLPVLIALVRLTNKKRVPVSGTLGMCLLNPVGLDGHSMPGRRNHASLGRNVNEWVDGVGLRGLKMTSRKYDKTDKVFGSLALATPWKDVTYTTRWPDGGWWDDAQKFWDGFRAKGQFDNNAETRETGDGMTDIGALGMRFKLKPGESVEIPLVLAWHFPTRENDWNGEQEVRGKKLVNYYATQFPGAWDIASYTVGNLERLKSESRLFQETLFESTLPSYVLDAVSSQVSTIRSNTAMRLEDGTFHGFEGCSGEVGCCPMNCTHVWNYEQALAHLFPALERTMRWTDYTQNIREDGSMAFRTLLPCGCAQWGFKPAADGQMGCIVKLYREWLHSGDRAFLEKLWPNAKRSLEFAWQHWDKDRDGVMEGEQHNTYDIEFHGPNPMMTILYLAALKAGAELARVVEDADAAREFAAVYEKGRRNIEKLWNGGYYEQKVVPPGSTKKWTPSQPEPRYQYGAGCLTDQMLGQWMCAVVGLGHVAEPDHVRKTLQSIFDHNWKTDLWNHHSCQRTYALGDEPGLLLCTWPRGGRPVFPFPYADEVWTGCEYQVAAHLIYEGMIEEGLSIVKGIRERHDGFRRNPWNEPECGDHYARPLSSWSVLTALSGYYYSAPEAELAFAPRLSLETFRALFTAGTAWGSYSQQMMDKRFSAALETRYGEFRLHTISVVPPVPLRARSSGKALCSVKINSEPCDAETRFSGNRLSVRLQWPANLGKGDVLRITIGPK